MGDLRRTNETATEDDLRDLFSLEADEEMQSIYRVCAGSWLYDGGGRWRFHADPVCAETDNLKLLEARKNDG